MYHPFIIGNRVYLRSIEKPDIEGRYFQWLNDYEITKYLESGKYPNSIEEMERYIEKIEKSPDDILLAVIVRESNIHIGNIKIGNINWINRTSDIGFLIGEKEYWKKGYATEALRLSVEYCFQRLNLHKILIGVISQNIASQRVCEKLGFSLEGSIKSWAYVDGEYYDKLYFGMSVEEYEKKYG